MRPLAWPCGLAGAAGVLGGLRPLRHPGGLAAALWSRSRPELGAAAPDQRGAAGGLSDLQTAHRAPSGAALVASPVLRVSWAASGLSGALAALLRPCGLDLAPELGAAAPGQRGAAGGPW